MCPLTRGERQGRMLTMQSCNLQTGKSDAVHFRRKVQVWSLADLIKILYSIIIFAYTSIYNASPANLAWRATSSEIIPPQYLELQPQQGRPEPVFPCAI